MTAVIGLSPALALAAPYRGVGHAPAADKDARAKALLRARTAALRAALDQLLGSQTPLPPEAKGKRGSAWTSAYRVLQQTQDGATIEVEVEVEIDTGRLINRYRQQPQTAVSSFYIDELVAHEGCLDETRGQLTQALLDRGAIASGAAGTPIRIEVQCQALGEVSYLRQVGGRVQVIVRDTKGTALAAGSGLGFAEDAEAAASNAVERVAIDLSRKLQAQDGEGVLIYLQEAWPAVQVRRLERALGTSLVGAREVALRGLSGDGSAVLRVVGPFDAQALVDQLPTLRIPGGQIEVVGIDSPRSLRIKIVEPPAPTP